MKNSKLARFFSKDQLMLQSMVLPGLIWYIVFCYIPMYGLTLAFRKYNYANGLIGSPFEGLRYFKELIADPDILNIIRNTVSIGVLKMIFFFPIPIIFAMLLNELTGRRLKRFVQTASYFPHFISWVVVSMIIIYWLNPQFGIVNWVLLELNLIDKPVAILSDADNFYAIAVISEMWKETGWSAIIYLAAIAGINPSLYESATIDGATKLQKIRYITLPGIVGAVIIMFLLNFAGIFSGGPGTFEQSFFLGRPMNYDRSYVLSYYVMKTGIQLGRFSYATAAGLINSVVSLILLLSSNFLSQKFLKRSLYSGGDM